MCHILFSDWSYSSSIKREVQSLWFIGYVPKEDLVTGIWLGNDDNSPTRGSSWQAATLWGKYMKEFVD